MKDFSVDFFSGEKRSTLTPKEPYCKPKEKCFTTTPNETCCKPQVKNLPQKLTASSCSGQDGCWYVDVILCFYPSWKTLNIIFQLLAANY